MTHLITATKDLDAVLAPLLKTPPPFVALDTEFMRRTTYWPQPCLIQVATPECIMLIDVLAPDVVLKPLWALLALPKVPKLLHAPEQDLEIFARLKAPVFDALFDVQIAAMCLEPTFMPSYADLVATYLGVTLDKAHQATRWDRRPLSESQCTYAADDVRYLAPLHEQLSSMLHAQGRWHWLTEDMERTKQKASAKPWTKVKGWAQGRYTKENFSLLNALATWREAEADTRDLPRQRILTDQEILDWVHKNKIPYLKFTERSAIDTLRIQNGQLTPPLPPARLSAQEKKRVEELKKYVQEVAAGYHIAPAFLATTKDAEYHVRHASWPCHIQGWRTEILKD